MTKKPRKKKVVAKKANPRKALGNSSAGRSMDKLKQKYSRY